jgi:hypothetical protein
MVARSRLTWQSCRHGWPRNERAMFSPDAGVYHLQSLITDTHCLVVGTLGVG